MSTITAYFHVMLEEKRDLKSESLNNEEVSPAGTWFIIAQDRAAFMRFVVIVKFPRETEVVFFGWLVGFFCPGICLLSVDAHSCSQEYALTSGL